MTPANQHTGIERLSDDLLPCPFCGEQPELRGSVVGCANKHCWGPSIWHMANAEDSITAWNRRTHPHSSSAVDGRVTVKPLADWSDLPRDLYVIEARQHDIGVDVIMCSVPMVTMPEVRYVRADMITRGGSNGRE